MDKVYALDKKASTTGVLLMALIWLRVFKGQFVSYDMLMTIVPGMIFDAALGLY